MLNGRIIKSSRKVIDGSHKMHAYSDTWDEAYDIDYDGELTDAVCATIINAFIASAEHVSQSGSSYGALRWELSDNCIRVNTEHRELRVTRGSGMCD